jgi:hypothetical protein
MLHKSRILGGFFRFGRLFLHPKWGSFFAQKDAKSCVCNKSLSSFPLFSIFFLFSTHFPHCRALPQPPSRAGFRVLSYPNNSRLPQLQPRVKRKIQGKTQVRK